jgi:hypothetical protein
MMDYSDYDFDSTAKAVYTMNESAQERYDNWHELREFMLSMASQYAYNDGCTSFATGGFHLAFSRGDGKVYVTPSVGAFTALNYAKAVKEKLNNICKLAA